MTSSARGASTTCSSATRCSRSTRTTTTRTCARAAAGRAGARGPPAESPSGGDDPHMLDLQRGSGRRAASDVSVAQADARRAFAIDPFVEQLAELAATRGASPAARRRRRSEILRAVPAAAASEHRRSALPSTASTRSSSASASTRYFGAPPADPGHHRRHARPADGRSGDPGVADRARAVAEHDVAAGQHDRVRGPRAPDFQRPQGARHASCIEAGRLVPTSSSSRATSCPSTRRYARPSKIVVADIYDPFHLEQLEQARDLGEATAAVTSCGRRPRCSTSSCARRLLPLRERQAARLLARPARRRGPDQPGRPTTPTRAGDADRGRAVRRERRRRPCARAARCSRASSRASAPTTR